VFRPPRTRGERVGVKPATKPSLDRCGCACKVSSRSLPEFGFPLALQIPTNRQIKFCALIFIFREEEDRRSTNY